MQRFAGDSGAAGPAEILQGDPRRIGAGFEHDLEVARLDPRQQRVGRVRVAPVETAGRAEAQPEQLGAQLEVAREGLPRGGGVAVGDLAADPPAGAAARQRGAAGEGENAGKTRGIVPGRRRFFAVERLDLEAVGQPVAKGFLEAGAAQLLLHPRPPDAIAGGRKFVVVEGIAFVHGSAEYSGSVPTFSNSSSTRCAESAGIARRSSASSPAAVA